MWLFTVGIRRVPDTVGAWVCVCLYADHTWIWTRENYFWLSDVFGLVSNREDCGGEVYITALVCSCGTQTPFHLTVLPSVMSTLPVCMSTSRASWTELATSMTTLPTPRLFNYVRKYIIYIHFEKKGTSTKCSVWTDSTLTSVDKCVYWMRSSAKSF